MDNIRIESSIEDTLKQLMPAAENSTPPQKSILNLSRRSDGLGRPGGSGHPSLSFSNPVTAAPNKIQFNGVGALRT
jgi:hypothetical protein